jgi:hypothetical protein
MARGKAISVKIPTERVIKALEASLAKLEKDYATQGEKRSKVPKENGSVEKGNWQVGF